MAGHEPEEILDDVVARVVRDRLKIRHDDAGCGNDDDVVVVIVVVAAGHGDRNQRQEREVEGSEGVSHVRSP